MITTTTGALPLPAGCTTQVRIGLPSTMTLTYSPLRGELASRATTPSSSAGSFALSGARLRDAARELVERVAGVDVARSPPSS